MHIERYTARDRDRWNAFARSSRNGTFLFDRNYMDYHADRFIDHSLLVSDDGGKLLALLPAHALDDRLVSHGGLTYGGFIVDDHMTASLMLDLFRDAAHAIRTSGFRTLVYKSIPHIYHRLPAEEDQYALFRAGARVVRRDHLAVIDYRASAGRQERRQRSVRKAEKAGLAIRETEDFDAFWAILAANLSSRHGVQPVHTVGEMALLKSRFPDRIRLFSACEGDEMRAGVLTYVSDFVCHAQYIGSSDEGREQGALDLIFDDLIGRFSAVSRYFDFGTSTERNGTFLNTGLSDFKEGFGARTVIHDHYELDLEAVSPDCFRNVRA
ncbi:MAG TPA: GNAT family N-acetyltransferase [Thermoanaerobaculia bacterium]|nr:GNAT family N-acetyltransferase [Thermoanaerobaculia bacterium]